MIVVSLFDLPSAYLLAVNFVHLNDTLEENQVLYMV